MRPSFHLINKLSLGGAPAGLRLKTSILGALLPSDWCRNNICRVKRARTRNKHSHGLYTQERFDLHALQFHYLFSDSTTRNICVVWFSLVGSTRLYAQAGP